MKATKRHWQIMTFVVALLGLTVGSALVGAQGSGDFAVSWWTAGGGGNTSSGGRYTLAGTVGQPGAGVLGGGAYTLQGGFQRCAVAHDVSGNGVVGITDVQFVASRWRRSPAGPADRNGDGRVTVLDVMLVAGQWGNRC